MEATKRLGGLSLTLCVGMCICVYIHKCVGVCNTHRTFSQRFSSRDRLMEKNDLRDRGPQGRMSLSL